METNINGKKNLVGIAVKFFVLMIIFTFVARGSYNMTIAEVEVENPSERKITHEIRNVGEIQPVNRIPVIVKEGITIFSVKVIPGDFVQAGDALFTLDADSLESLIKNKQREIDVLNLQIKAAENAAGGAEAGIVDTAAAQGKISRTQMQEELNGYLSLKETGGIICTPNAGTVLEVNAKPGNKTSGTAEMILSDSASGVVAVSEFSADEQSFFQSDSAIKIQTKDGIEIRGITVRSFSDKSDAQGRLEVVFELPENDLKVGEAVNVVISKLSKSYPTCVPPSALHQSTGNAYYINTAEEVETILGTEWRIVRNEVAVLDKNENYVAVDGISYQQQVVVNSTRVLDENSKVKIRSKAVGVSEE
jgi:multidrug efflux pump subunit AcrA (membrane-fusion protein)